MIERGSETTAIGVGMGGSCPDCNAPVDLGQEFCLECGAPIRLRPATRRKRQTTTVAGPAVAASGLAAPVRRGFPWVPFLIVLALVVVGVVFALLSADENTERDSAKAETSTKSDTISTATESNTQTVVSTGCTQGVATTGATTTFGSTTPTLATPGAQAADATGLATTTPTFSEPTAVTPGAASTGSGTPIVTVNERGELCGSGSSGTPNGQANGSTPLATTPPAGSGVPNASGTTPAIPGAGTTPTTPGTIPTGGDDMTGGPKNLEWPGGKSGFTVVLASFSQRDYREADAQIRAAQAQKAGLSSGVLDSNDFSSLRANLWVVFSGIYDTEAEAENAESGVRAKGYQGAYVREVKP